MIENDKQMDQTKELRRLAEEMVRKRADLPPENLEELVPEDIGLMFHELSVHQHELEMQNEELRRTQGELDSARARYFDLYDMAPVGYVTLSDQGLIVEANLTAATLLGAGRGALIKQPLSRFIHSEDQDVYYLHQQKDFEVEAPQVCELRMVREDGTVFWAHLTATLARQNGSAPEYRMVMSDITEQKRAEGALRQSEQKEKEAKKLLKLVLDTIPVRLFWKDLSSVFLGCNLLFAQDAGFQVPEELIGLDDFSTGWKEQAEIYRRDDLEVMTSGTPKLHYEEMQTTPDGRQIWLSTSKVPLRDADDKIIGVLGTYEDITQHKWAEEELLKTQKLESLGLLAGGIAHDFNNILMVIMGNISFAKMVLSPTDKAYERLSIAETASLKAKELTQQFLTFSQGGAPVKRLIAVGSVIKAYGRFALSGAKSTCEYMLPEDLWPVEADEGQIGQAVANMLINADQAMEDGGTIRVHGENVVVGDDRHLPLKSGNYIKIAIQDQGCGIAEEHLGKIFDPYFTTHTPGRGLGLASVYSIVKKHEGHVAVESTAGAGATFTLFLPASPSEVPIPDKVDEPAILAGKGRILVMDDDEIILQVVGAMLEDLGYEFVFAPEGKAAIAQYVEARQSARPFDAVIMDLTIPGGMGGKEAMQKLLVIDPQARVIVSSGYHTDPVMANYQSYGFRGILVKPYRLAELSEQMRRVLGNEGCP